MVAGVQSQGKVVVIGSGPAGAAAALFLAQAGAETLVMEAGSARAELGFTLRVGGLTLAKRRSRALEQRPDLLRVKDPRIQIFEELAPGGLSNHWSCAVPRFSHEDFLDGERAGEAYTWPLGYADLAPWYERVEPLLNIAGGERESPHLPRARLRARWRLSQDWEALAAGAERLGRSVLVMPYANGASTMFTRSATAFNAYTQLLVPALRQGLLDIVYDAKALRLEWSAADRRVVAVVYRDLRTGREERMPCKAVVLAAGALNSAQVLLQSSSPDFPGGLGNQHDVVGRYLHDHPIAKLVIDVKRPFSFHPACYLTRPPLERSPALYAAACMQWGGAPALAKSALARRWGRSPQLGFSVFGTMVPTPDDRVALAAQGGLTIQLQHAPEAHRALEQARDDALQLLAEGGLEPRLQSWTVEPPGNSVHYAGTCRMHASSRFGVVDGVGRVHGVANVAVADSSVFTTGPEKNPVLTAMALAARAGDALAKDLARGQV